MIILYVETVASTIVSTVYKAAADGEPSLVLERAENMVSCCSAPSAPFYASVVSSSAKGSSKITVTLNPTAVKS